MSSYRRFALVLAAAALLLGPACTISTTESNNGSSKFRIGQYNDGRVQVSWSSGWQTIKLKMKGEIELSPDDASVVSIDRNGYFVLTERRGLSLTKLRVEPKDDGTLDFRYSVGALQRKFDEDAREWVGRVLPRLVDETGLFADRRAREVLEARGLDGLFEAVADIDSDRTKSIYYTVTLEEAELTTGDIDRIYESLEREVDSDYYKASVLEEAGKLPVAREVLSRSYFDTVASLDSDYYKAELLSPLARRTDLDTVDMPGFFHALDEVDSDYHRQVILSYLLDRSDIDDASLRTALELTRDIHSDYHRAVLLDMLQRRVPADAETREVYFEAIGEIPSEHHRVNLLTGLLENNPRDDVVLDYVLDATRDFDSDHQKATLLNRVIGHADDDERLLAYLDVALTLDSDHRLSQALSVLLQRDDLSEDVLRRMLVVTKENIDSNHQRGLLLDSITDRLPATL